ncbi:MAG: tRNA dihydrouridine synthase DusB [Kiritimatiellae bacterium]|nr:tRNA dihydrouridine synthase DusB [Kiritimatiellia bacterium]
MNSPLRIGNVTLTSPLLLAPMAGYTDWPFRMAIRCLGGIGLAYTEMIDPKSVLCGGGRKRKAILATSPDDRPLGYQIYGTDAALMSNTAQWLADQGATLIDINMGCPQKKIVRRGSGAGLLKTPREAVRLASHIVKAVSIPVTVKLRSGWDEEDTDVALASALEENGIAAITIHGRTCLQRYSGQANWEAIRQMIARVKIPVIGNGDITSPSVAQAMFSETGCAGIMVGRAALKNPWIFRDIHSTLNGIPFIMPTWQEKLEFMRRHFEAMVSQHGEPIGALLFHRWIPQYSRGMNLGRDTMLALLQIREADKLRRHFQDLEEQF